MNRRNLSTSRYEAISLRNCSSSPCWTRRTNSMRRFASSGVGSASGRYGPRYFSQSSPRKSRPRSPCGLRSRPLSVWKRSFRNARSTGSTSVYRPRYAFSMLAGDGERHLGQRRARRGHAGLAEEGEGECLARLRGVERPALELQSAGGRGNRRDRRGPDRPGRNASGPRPTPCRRRSPNSGGRRPGTSCPPP